MPTNGKITGQDVIDQGAISQVQKLDAELRKILKTYNELAKAAKKVTGPQGSNKVLKERNNLDKQAIEIATKLARQKKAEADAEAAKQRQIKAGLQTQKLQNQEESKAFGQRSSNIAQFRSLNSAYAQESRLLNLLRQRQKDLNIQRLQGTRLTKSQQAELRRLTTRIRNLDRNLKKVDAAAGQFQRNVGNYPKVVGAATRSLRAFAGAFGFTSGIFLLVSALRQTFQIFKDFDQAQADLAAILGKNRKEIKRLTKQAKELGATTAFTATQVAKLQLELSKLGFTEEQILASAEAVENLAVATGVEAARAAKLAGAAIRGFALEAEEANRVAAVLAVSTTKSASSFETLEISLPKVSAIAKAFNFSIEDTVALLSGLRNAGFEASIAGNSLKQIFLQLADSNGKLAKRLGGNVNNFDELVEAFKKVENEGIDLAEAFELTNARSVAAFKVFLQGADDLKTLRDSITDVEEELSNLADTKLDSLQGDITLLTSAWQGFVLSIEDGTGKISEFFRTAVQGLTNFFSGLQEVNTTPQEAGIRAAERLVEDFKNSTQSTQEEVKNFIIKTVQDSEDNIDQLRNKLNELIDGSLITRNSDGELIQLGLDFDGTLDEAKELEKALKKEIATRNELFNQLNLEQDRRESLISEAVKLSAELAEQEEREIDVTKQLTYFRGLATLEIEKIIKLYNAQIEARKENNKSASDEEKLLKGTIAFYEDFIKKQIELQKKTALTSEEFARFQVEIDKARIKILQLQGEFAKIGKGVKLPETVLDLEVLSSSDIEDEVTRSIELARKRAETIKGFEQDIRDAVQDTFTSFSEFYNIDLSAFNSLFDGKKNTISDYQNIAQESANFLLGNTLEAYDREIKANQSKLNAILEDDSLSDEQKEEAKKRFENEEKKIRQKQYKAEQDFLIAKIAIDTAANVAKILTTASVLASNPVTAPLAPNAFAQAAIASAIGAAQIVFVKSRKPPEFYKGKDLLNSYEGWATWGEKRREVNVDERGNIEVSPNKTTPRFVKSSDIIVPSMSKFNQEIRNPDSDVYNRVSQRLTRETNERTQLLKFDNRIDLTPLKGLIQKEIVSGFKKANIHIHNKVKIEDNYSEY